MVEERRHSYHEVQEVFRMLVENYLRCSNRDSGITHGDANDTTEQCRERCIHSWLGKRRKPVLTGLRIRTLGVFGFEGASTVGDGSCDPPTRSMGVVFCNFSVMQWNTTTPLPQMILQEQWIRESIKVGREEEDLSSNRPELVALREWLEAPDDHIDLLYLTDSEESLQVIHKWIGCGVKLNLLDFDQQSVKTHRGDPLNEEADIRAELKHLKKSTRKRYGMTHPTELCINYPSPPQTFGGQRFLRLRYGLTRCTIILDRKREK